MPSCSMLGPSIRLLLQLIVSSARKLTFWKISPQKKLAMVLSCTPSFVNWCSLFHLLVFTLNPFGTWLRPTAVPSPAPLATSPVTPLWTCHSGALQLRSPRSWSGQQQAWQVHHGRVGLFSFGLSGLQLITVSLHHRATLWGKTLLNSASYCSLCLLEYGTGNHWSFYQSPTATCCVAGINFVAWCSA